MEHSKQTWVTSVVTDDQAIKALVLLYSMKRALTTRKFAILISMNVSQHLKELLSDTFDLFFVLDESRNTAKLNVSHFAPLFTLTLHSFDQCVYLPPTMMVVSNCDDIFKKYKSVDRLIFTADMSIWMTRPCLKTFKELMACLHCQPEQEQHAYLTCLTRKMNNNCFIEPQYNFQVTSAGGMPPSTGPICMVKFTFNPNLEGLGQTENLGFVQKNLTTKWLDLYNSVKSLLETGIQQHITLPPTYAKEPIAIVGMSCRYPNANNLQEFWELLIEGNDATHTTPKDRWLREQNSQFWPNCKNTNAGYLKPSTDEFDAKFFGISPKEAVEMDPQHRLLHHLVWEALEDAAINPDTLPGSDGSVFVGSWTNDYKDVLTDAQSTEYLRAYMGNSIGASAARISFLLGMTGPSVATESGCSSAMVGVHLACRSLLLGETSMALACGVNLLLRPFDKEIMPAIISPGGHCKTFDANADGFARAEGCGVLVLKRLSDAVKDNDTIWGLIRGSAMTQEGLTRSLMTPTVYSESLAMELALEDAGVKPEMVSLIEAHGTGTQVGDSLEIAAISKAYGGNRSNPLVIGSVKTNVGHTESCSGITGIMKVVLAMHHKIIPAHKNLSELHPNICLESIPAVIPLEPMPWESYDKRRYAGVSSFGITGTDVHVILEEPPNNVQKIVQEFNRPRHMLTISAKSPEALEVLVQKYKFSLANNSSSVEDICHTANTGRASFPFRVGITGNSSSEMVTNIEQHNYFKEQISADSGKICFLFTGQGSQYPVMGKTLYETTPIFHMHFDYCEKILREQYSIEIKNVLWSSSSCEISQTIFSQTSIFCIEYALFKLWESWGVKPDYVLGHSLGEFCAAVCAGLLSVEDALKLVAERSRLIDALPRGKMLVVKSDGASVTKLLEKFSRNNSYTEIDLAAINSTEQTVLAGDSHGIEMFAEYCKENGIKCIFLDATHAFHSRFMDAILPEYSLATKSLQQKSKNEQKCGFISGMCGTLVNGNNINGNYWLDHSRKPVEFLNASTIAVELGCNLFIEIGPQPVLSALTMINNTGSLVCVPSLKKNEDNWVTMLNSLAKLYVTGVSIDWNEFDRFYSRVKVRLPHYPFMGKKYWPELTNVNSKSIHPLLGSVINTASDLKFFECLMSLGNLEYVRDHAIGQHFVFPGAAYLEMCLAAQMSTEGTIDSFSTINVPIVIRNLSILNPLELTQNATKVQTIVNNDQASTQHGMSIKIFHMDSEDDSNWIQHTHATLSRSTFPSHVTIDMDLFQNTIKITSEQFTVEKTYEKLASNGLIFGPVFRSLEQIWMLEERKILIAKVKVPEDNSKYILHPVKIDAMIQSVMFYQNTKFGKKIFVPVKISQFNWLSASQMKNVYIYVDQNPETNTEMAVLLNPNGNIIAVMSGVEFVETTVKAIEAVLNQSKVSMPGLWEEIWKPTNAGNDSLNLEKSKGTFCAKEVLQKHNILSPETTKTLEELQELTYYIMLRALYECNWTPKVNQSFDENQLFHKLQIKPQFRQYFSFMLNSLAEEGILVKVTNSNWKVAHIPMTLKGINAHLSSPRLNVDLVKKFKSASLLIKTGENLSKILQGHQEALSLLFPDETSQGPAAGDMYHDIATYFSEADAVTDVARQWLQHCKVAMGGNKFVLRILEIGAGTGTFTSTLLKILREEAINFEYTFTDISPTFFSAAETKFGKEFILKRLNIEKDPIEQGFIPEYYDYICASDVIHTTKNIGESIQNIRMLLKCNGRLDLVELTRQNRYITFLFGLLNGFWRFEDFELRPNHCTLTCDNWLETFEAYGYTVLGTAKCANEYHSVISVEKSPDNPTRFNSPIKDVPAWLIFREMSDPVSGFLQDKIQSVGRQTIMITPGATFVCKQKNSTFEFQIRPEQETDFNKLMDHLTTLGINMEGILYCWALGNKSDQEEILQPYFYLTKAILLLKQTQKFVTLTQGISPIGDNDLAPPHQSTLLGFVKSLKNENSHLNCSIIDIDWNMTKDNLAPIISELWNTTDFHVSFRNGVKYLPKLHQLKPSSSGLKLPRGTDRFQLTFPKTNSITDLQFGPAPTPILGKYEIEIKVKECGLNFRDVISVLKATDQFKNSNKMGFDLVGVVHRVGSNVSKWSSGDTVWAFNIQNETALPSHIVVPENGACRLPPQMTFKQACTLWL